MLIYNVTIKIDKHAEAEWLQWMKTIHIPDMMNIKMFVASLICKLLEEPDEEGSTYLFQYECENMEKLDEYLEKFAPALRADALQRFKDKFVASRTVMEIV